MTTLRGITWNHSRGYVPLAAVSQRFCERFPGTDIQWEKRSLKEFGDAALDTLAERYDLLVIDHPWAGFAVRRGVVLPLETRLPADFLQDQRSHTVGRSFESYCFEGRQSALPIDAAAPIAAYRPEWFAAEQRPLPHTWGEVLALAKQGRVLYAGDPTNVLMQFYTFANSLTDSLFRPGSAQVIDPADGRLALEHMRELAALCPALAFQCDPIAVYEQLGGKSNFVYTPFEFGYVNYARRGYAQHRVYGADVVSCEGRALRTPLGGTGLAISARCAAPEAALAFVQYAASAEVQTTLYFENGGQPGHRKAWLDEENNRQSGNFFRDTLPALDRAWLRPRYDGYLYFQDRAAPLLRDCLRGDIAQTDALHTLDALYQTSLRQGGEHTIWNC